MDFVNSEPIYELLQNPKKHKLFFLVKGNIGIIIFLLGFLNSRIPSTTSQCVPNVDVRNPLGSYLASRVWGLGFREGFGLREG